MSDVFISYKRENLAAVGRLVEALRAEGIGVWWDQDIAPNAAWEATIEKALAAAKLVIVAWSPAAVASDNVKAEARGARGQGRLLQVFVEACEPPLFFGERQGVDLKAWSGAPSDAGFRMVLEAVRSGLIQPATPGSDDAPPPRVGATADTPPPLPSKPSVAVLPFANLSGDPDQDYFADGIVVEVVAALSRNPGIFVIASGSSLSFKGKGVSSAEAGRQLGVRYVLEGSVRKAGNRVRISVQLIDATDGAQIWASRFEDSLEDIFALQDRVALGVAAQIEPTVRQAEMQRASARPTENMGSYDLYLRALSKVTTYAKADVLEALELGDRAVALDPDFGLALALAAVCRYVIAIYGWSDDPEGARRQGIELAHQALRAAGDDAFVLVNAAFVVAGLEGDLSAATALVDRSLALNPGSAHAWRISGVVRLRSGKTDLGIEHLETAMRLDPAPMGSHRRTQLAYMGLARFQQRRFSEAAALEREIVQQVDLPLGYALLAAAYGHLGQIGEALEALNRYRSVTQQPIDVHMRTVMDDPTHIKLFLDGIALAEGKSPPKTPVRAERP